MLIKMMSSSTFRSLSAGELSADPAWWEIYEKSFPPAEREHAEVIVSSIKSGTGMAFGAWTGKDLTGISSIHLLKKPAVVFMVYISVAPGYRGQGIGTSFLNHVFEEGQRRMEACGLTPAGMVWEVERPEDVFEETEKNCRIKRMNFFKRNQAVLLPAAYVQPPVDGVTPVPMHLMFRPSVSCEDQGQFTRDLIKAIYFEKYGAVNGISEAMLHGLYSSLE